MPILKDGERSEFSEKNFKPLWDECYHRIGRHEDIFNNVCFVIREKDFLFSFISFSEQYRNKNLPLSLLLLEQQHHTSPAGQTVLVKN